MKVKDAKKHVQFDKSRNGCGLGCCSIGCMGIIGMFIMVGVVGYYGLWHTGFPLQIIKSAIEEDGKVDIKGLTGTLASGFSADELRFKTVEDHWSNLTDIKFKYDSDSSIFGTDRLVIEELSVNGGTIYADWDADENEIGLDPDDFRDEFQEIDDEFEEFGDEWREDVGHSPAIRELRIDLVSVSNIKIVNPATQLEVTIDEIKFDGFRWEEGDLQSLGELLVRSSQLDLKTVPSVEFAEMKNARRFEGTLGAQADHRLKADVPFVFDFCVDDKLNVFSRSEIFDGQIRIVEGADQTILSYVDFSPEDFIDLENGAVMPSNVNLELEFGENKEKGPNQVNNDGEFKFGITRFSDLRIEKPEDGLPIMVAAGIVNGETVQASIKITSPFSPWLNINLNNKGFDTPEDLWAQTLFGSDFKELASKEQTAVRASMPEKKGETAEDREQAEGETNVLVDTEDVETEDVEDEDVEDDGANALDDGEATSDSCP